MQEIIKSGNIDDLCPSSVVNELEIRKRGQHENPLWYKVKNRITASIFHDVFFWLLVRVFAPAEEI
jgi:hypothetical protein